jgi:hypothetical protein
LAKAGGRGVRVESLMECPFCAEAIRDEAIACKHCGRDLALVRPVILEIQELVSELDKLQRKLDAANTRLALRDEPGRFLSIYAGLYLLPAALLLLLAHYLVTFQFNVSPIFLRLASFVIPIPFGVAAYALSKIGVRSALVLGAMLGLTSVGGMLTVVGIIDDVPIIPSNLLEWRETIEYSFSIALAFVTGNILALLVFVVLPSTLASSDKPSPFAYKLAQSFGRHVGDEGLRRRARRIQDLLRTIGPLAGLAGTAAGSIYTGLKGFLGV